MEKGGEVQSSIHQKKFFFGNRFICFFFYSYTIPIGTHARGHSRGRRYARVREAFCRLDEGFTTPFQRMPTAHENDTTQVFVETESEPYAEETETARNAE